MANGNFFKDAFGKAKQILEGFLYRDEGGNAPVPSAMEDQYPAPAEGVYAQQPQTVTYQAQPANYAAMGMQYQQPQQQPAQMAYSPYQAYQQAYPTAYPQQYQHPAQPQQLQQPQQFQQPQQAQQFQQPAQQQPRMSIFQATTRNRRADRTPQMENNVVDFAAYQQGQQPQEAAPQQAPAAASARIINARGMADCRSAITLLRNGDAVLIVLENVTDPAEMRRLVDTLSGACYSLTATITKVSRYGVYLLAPQNVAVYADQATSQMNSAPNRSAVRAPQQQPYGNSGYAGYPQNNPYAAPQQNGFMQRPAAPEEAAQPFYTRTAPQAGQMPAFSTQPAAAGYAPDETMAVDQ